MAGLWYRSRGLSGGGKAQESLDIRGKTGLIQLDPRQTAFLSELPEEAQEAAIPAGHFPGLESERADRRTLGDLPFNLGGVG